MKVLHEPNPALSLATRQTGDQAARANSRSGSRLPIPVKSTLWAEWAHQSGQYKQILFSPSCVSIKDADPPSNKSVFERVTL